MAQDYCACMVRRVPRDVVRDLRDEIVEFLHDPCADEWSDVMFGIGRLLAGIIGRVYVRIPGDRLHVAKIDERMQEYGCVRSRRAVSAGDGCR